MKKFIKILLVILWMGVIFYFSSRNGSESTSDSDGIIRNVVCKCIGLFTCDYECDVSKWTFIVRKLAHFSEYAILGILVMNCFDKLCVKDIVLSILVCFLYSVSDEVHQYFIPGRSCLFTDMLIDTSGASISSALYYFVRRKHK